jgi:hypothetical protein
MSPSNISSLVALVTIILIVIVSSKQAKAGPVAFAACMCQAAGPICASLSGLGNQIGLVF